MMRGPVKGMWTTKGDVDHKRGCGPWDVDHGMWTMECGPWNVDHGMWRNKIYRHLNKIEQNKKKAKLATLEST